MGVAGPVLQKPSTKHFLLSRLHSLSGIIPLGLFLLEHFFSNATAILGEAAYNKQINLLQKITFLPLIEIVFIAIPLLFHAIYGIHLSLISKNKSFVYPYKRNLMFFFQRVTGILTLIFIVYHVWSFRLKSIFFGTEINYQTVSTDLLNPWIFIIYVLGVISTSYHFCNGLSTAAITWGITIGKNAQKAASNLAICAFVILSIVGISSLLAFI
jgi:succinate dehydrogenase / fumarate reductase, cytochrome b subunit